MKRSKQVYPLQSAKIIQSKCVVNGETSLPELYMIENGKKINLEEMNVYIDDSGCKEETGSVFVGMDVGKKYGQI